jgi:ribosome-associated protein
MDETWSRTDQKRANRAKEEALTRLCDDLSRLGEAKLPELELSEEIHDAVLTLQRITSAPARNRQLRRLRSLIRDEDFATIEARLSSLRRHGSVSAGAAETETNRREASWTLRLLGEGSVGLEAFVAEFPQADRTHLRQLVHAVNRATHERRNKAEAKLRSALRGFLR